MRIMMFTLASSNPVGHVTDKPWWGSWAFSNVSFMLILSGLVTLTIVLPAARRITTGKTGTLEDLQTRGTLANIVEAICLYLREEVFQPVLHDQTDKYVPMLWTFFWFILVNNLLGLVPILDITAALGVNPAIDPHTGQAILSHGHPTFFGVGGTATQSIWVTGALAAVAFLWFNGVGFVKDPLGYLKHLTAGAPVYMWPIMVPVEVLGMFVKPVALALRLFANMTGGHIIVATLLSFVVGLATAKTMNPAIGHGLAIIPLVGTIAVYFLEIMVAFIQAYIFTFLSCLFLGQLVVHEHDGEHDHGAEAHTHLPHATPEGVDQTKSVPLGQSQTANLGA